MAQNHDDLYLSAVQSFVGVDPADLTDSDRNTLATTVASIPPAARGGAQSAALLWLATNHPGAMSDVLSIVNDLPSSAVNRVRATLDSDTADAVRSLISDRLADSLSNVDLSAFDTADSDLLSAFVGKIRDRVTDAVSNVPTGGRQAVDGTLADIVGKGVLHVGSTVTYDHKGTTHTATVVETDDGDVVLETSDDVQHDSVSAAARHCNGGQSVNGWQAWRYGKGTLGSMR
jgi:hypothetical protein